MDTEIYEIICYSEVSIFKYMDCIIAKIWKINEQGF